MSEPVSESSLTSLARTAPSLIEREVTEFLVTALTARALPLIARKTPSVATPLAYVSLFLSVRMSITPL
jgi:hypothetical protein